jgi:hypothetical protein
VYICMYVYNIEVYAYIAEALVLRSVPGERGAPLRTGAYACIYVCMYMM